VVSAVRPGSLILASRSPQRTAILTQLGVAHEVRPADAPELEQGDPVAVAVENARRKAQAVDGDLVLGVDTVVALEGRLYGKPADADAAWATLRALSGATHQVVSGLALRLNGEVRVAESVTDVTFRELGDGVVAWYIATEEWRGRAGGYAIQGRGAALVRRIDGDYLNVVGLPISVLLDLEPGLIFRR
jgi:septum formation protein